jgi:MFS transporter, AAHS family, 4-hydroxybenzoate transporter
VSYALASWIPTLLVDFGFSPIQAPLGAAAYGVGGLVGGILVLSVMGRFGIRPVLMITSLVAIMSIGTMSHVTASSSLLLPLIGAIGAGVITGCVGQSALAVSFYPVSLRTTGVGWAAACGRIGSVVGPAVGGALLSLQWSARDIILTAIPLIAIAIIVLATMSLAERRQALART